MALTSQIRYAFAADNTLTTGAGKSGLAFGNITAKYLVNGGTLQSLTTETITTLGTYQVPTSSAHIRIKELAAAEPTTGIYEIHFHDTQLATGSRLWLFLSASGAKFQPLEIDLATKPAIDALPTAAAIATSAWAEILEAGFSASRLLRIIAAATAGEDTGEPGSPVFRNLADTQDQVTGTADAYGNRSGITYGS